MSSWDEVTEVKDMSQMPRARRPSSPQDVRLREGYVAPSQDQLRMWARAQIQCNGCTEDQFCSIDCILKHYCETI